jgi:hypothetical protein
LEMDPSSAFTYPQPSRCRRDTYVMVFMSEFVLITVSLCLMTADCDEDAAERRLGDDDSEACQTTNETYYLVALAYILSIKYIAYYFSFVVVDTYPMRAANADKQCILNLWKQYIAALLFSAFLCILAAILYSVPRWITFVVYLGSITNAVLAIDCLCQARAAHYKVNHMVFPNVEEIVPLAYRNIRDDAEGNVWHLKECMICLCDFEPRDSVVHLPCKHIFHTDCVAGWLRQHKGCPVKCPLPPHRLVLPPPTGPALVPLAEAVSLGTRRRQRAWSEDWDEDGAPLPGMVGAPEGR